MNLDLSKISDIEFENIDFRDSPDFVDSFIGKAFIGYPNGGSRELTEEELEYLNNERREFVYEKLMEYLY